MSYHPSPSTPMLQLNRGLCSLMVMEDLDLIPPDDVKSVSVQLVTYNGNQKSAFGSISIDFKFEDGREIYLRQQVHSGAVPVARYYSVPGLAQVSLWVETSCGLYLV